MRSLTKPTVSVLLPVFNGERYLKEAIDSIICQTFTDFEFLIINDGSTDDSADIVRTYNDSRIRLIENRNNLGLIDTLNKGIELSRARYIARMDCDDISLPDRLARQLAFLEDNPMVAVVGTGYELIGERGELLGGHTYPLRNFEINWALLFYSPIIHPSVMMRTKVIRDIGGYRKGALYCEDYDLWWRVSRVAQLANLAHILLLLRKHDESVTRANFSDHERNSNEIRRAMISERLGRNISVESVATLRTGGVGIEGTLEASRLIYLLCKSFKDSQQLTRDEKRAIRKDAGAKIMDTIRPQYWHPRIWQYALIALTLNSQYTIKRLLRLIALGVRSVVHRFKLKA